MRFGAFVEYVDCSAHLSARAIRRIAIGWRATLESNPGLASWGHPLNYVPNLVHCPEKEARMRALRARWDVIRAGDPER